MNTKQLNRRQARWSAMINEYDFEIQYREGAKMGKPDALSRRFDMEIQPGDDNQLGQFRSMLKPSHFIEDVRTASLNRISVSDIAEAYNLKKELLTDEKAMAVNNIKDETGEYPEHWKSEDGLLTFKDLVYVPEGCRETMMLTHHDSVSGGHKGPRPTLELISRNYWWPRMAKFIKQYVDECPICKRSKTGHRKPYGKLQPMPIANIPWGSISLDFIVKLPLSDGFDSVLVVIDRMTKMGHFIPCNEACNAKEVATLVRKNIFKLHGTPSNIVSDRGVSFNSTFWKNYLESLGIKRTMSTAYHPQTDGQTERLNAILKQYLRAYVNYAQDDWASLLDVAEFSYNNTHQSAIKTTPFYANMGYHPPFLANNSMIIRDECPNAVENVKTIHALQEELVTHLTKAAEEMKVYADRGRQDIAQFKVGTKVYLSSTNIASNRPSASLENRNYGPFTILEHIGPLAYRLELPPSMRCHPVFHVSRLTPAVEPSVPTRVILPPPPVFVNNQEEQYVESILDMRIHRGRIQYLVKWVNMSFENNKWLSAEEVEDCEALDVYEQTHKEGCQAKKLEWDMLQGRKKDARQAKRKTQRKDKKMKATAKKQRLLTTQTATRPIPATSSPTNATTTKSLLENSSIAKNLTPTTRASSRSNFGRRGVVLDL